MKIDRPEEMHRPEAAGPRKEPFHTLLGEKAARPVRPPPAPPPAAKPTHAPPAKPAQATPARSGPGQVVSAQLIARSTTHRRADEGLRQVRRSNEVETGRLGTVRQELSAAQHERAEDRMRELIARELSRDPGPERPSPAARPPGSAPTPTTGTAITPGTGLQPPPSTQAQPGAEPSPAASAAAVHELVEKLELFLRSQRPGLSMMVGGALAAEVLVEKTGPGEVALRILGRRGLPKASDLALLREQISARGLKLSALSIG